MDFVSRLRAAFLTSIADLFFGAASILLILIVLARPADESRVQRFVDMQLWCERVKDAWLLAPAHGATRWTMAEWLEKETSGALLIRVGLWTQRAEMDCFRRFNEAARMHNAGLTQRGKVTASVATVLLPGNGGRNASEGKPQ